MTHTVKVLHLIDGLGSGGAEKLLYTNLRHLNRELIENYVVSVFSDQTYWQDPISDLGIPIQGLEISSRRQIVQGVRRLLNILRDVKPDVIHTHLWTANIIGRIAGSIAGVPVISSIHSLDYEPETLTDASGFTRQKLFLSRLADKWTAKIGCKTMIAVSKRARESGHQRLGFPLENILVLYNPIDIVAEEYDSIVEQGLETRCDVTPIILTVGRIAPQKGHVYAVRAMPLIRKIFPGAELHVVGAKGDPDYFKLVVEEMERLGVQNSIRLLGEQRNVIEHLRGCCIFVFPTLLEGLGIALIEAMAAGCACVASRIAPLSEFVNDGANGILVDPGSPDALAAAVTRLLNDHSLRRRLGDAARETALERFRPQPAAERLTEIYFSVSASVRGSG